jgi:hypothetical protein
MNPMQTTQGELFPAGDTLALSDLEVYLCDGLSRPVDVTLTRNRVSMLSVDFGRGSPIKIRMHEQYLQADMSVFRALRLFLRSGNRDAWRRAAKYAQCIEPAPAGQRRTRRIRTRGEVHDLKAIAYEVNRELFSRRVSCRVGWGRPGTRKGRRKRSKSIRFGSWTPSDRTVRVHPLLDDRRVPREFVKYIVFHEMLHAVVPSTRRNNRRYDHSPEFRALENGFPGLGEMRRMAVRLLDVLV